jgi:SAM-dependent methyltransferase
MKAKIKKIIKDRLLKILVPSGFYYKSRGYCPCCDKEVFFLGTTPDIRERFKCENCRSSSRERSLILAIQKYFPDWRNLSIHESSPEMRGASLKLSTECKNYIASQYYPDKKFGDTVDGFRNENLEDQTFGDEMFDIVVTMDVMEHVFFPDKAFKEISRTLKKGGAHIFTVPVMNQHFPSEVWSKLGDDGKPVYLKPPEYHGNPISGEGSLVTMYWGYDILDYIKKSSGLRTIVENLESRENGVIREIDVFVSFKD